MRFTQATAQLQAAAEESLARIRRDREEAPPKLKPLLSHIEANLFNPDLRVGELKRACGIRDNSISIQFRSALGQPPSTYIEECRLQIASRLLRDTEISISLITELLGYSNLQVFSTAFHRWAGQRPNPYRKKFRKFPRLGPALDESTLCTETLRQALMGTLPPAEAQIIVQRLQDIYNSHSELDAIDGFEQIDDRSWIEEPAIQQLPRTTRPTISSEERSAAQTIWESLRFFSPAEQRLMVRGGASPCSVALFELLLDHSRQVGQEDAQEGVEMAELALETLYLAEIGKLFAEDHQAALHFANLKTLGWARLGDARRLTLDLVGAEKAFSIADKHLPAQGQDRLVLAELQHQKAALRWYQQNLEEALTLENRAIPLFRLTGRPPLLAEALLARAIINSTSGHPQAAIPDLCEALQLLNERESPRRTLEAYYQLAAAYLHSGYLPEAAEILALAQSLSKRIEDDFLSTCLQWLEGSLLQKQGHFDRAEGELLKARDRFIKRRRYNYAALVSLDLALLYYKVGQIPAAFELASETVPIFEVLALRREAMTALRMLHEAVESNRLTLEILQKVRGSLEEIRRDPTSSAFASR